MPSRKVSTSATVNSWTLAAARMVVNGTVGTGGTSPNAINASIKPIGHFSVSLLHVHCLAECMSLLTNLVSDKEIFYTQKDDW